MGLRGGLYKFILSKKYYYEMVIESNPKIFFTKNNKKGLEFLFYGFEILTVCAIGALPAKKPTVPATPESDGVKRPAGSL
jgi:hypothetical protein